VFVSSNEVFSFDGGHPIAVVELTPSRRMFSFLFIPSWRTIDGNAMNGAQGIALVLP
jgi:hypothetical protein